MRRIDEYKKEIKNLEAEARYLKRQLSKVLLYRLLCFGVMITGFILLWPVQVALAVVFAAFALTGFLALVKFNNNLKSLKEINQLQQDLNHAEIKAQKGDHSYFNGGVYHRTIDHAYAYDLDIFGEHSFYQSLNRTSTIAGDELLGAMAADKINYTEDLSARQSIVKEMAGKFELRQKFYVHGHHYTTEKKEMDYLDQWQKAFKPYVTNSWFWKIYMFLMPVLMFGAVAIYSLDMINVITLIILLLIPLGLTSFKLKHTNAVHFSGSESYKYLKKAGALLNLVESENFSSDELNTKKNKLEANGWKSDDIDRLGKIINSFDNRLNPIMGAILNIFFAWDIQCMYRIEKWIDAYSGNFSVLFEQLAWWDVQISLGTYAYNHSHFNYPVRGDNIVKAEQIGHPFLPEEVCVRNDFELNEMGEFVIITGANMAGKSTFLRTVGLSLVMAKMGLPLYADKFEFMPLKLYTSMRTTDSLQENESYFYTELKRLKALTSHLQEGEKLFVILDEILKGTNSRDKAEGSKRFVKKLLNYPVVGIIATHDLSLTSLGMEEEKVKNICFEVEFGKDDLIFDYKLKPGVCKNMNATWLLEKMNLV